MDWNNINNLLGRKGLRPGSKNQIVTYDAVYQPNGKLTWISINSQPLFGADGTTLAGVVASLADISERKRIEQTLEDRSRELARLRREVVGR